MVMVGLMLMRSSVVSVETDKKAVINTGMDEFVCDDKSTTEYQTTSKEDETQGVKITKRTENIYYNETTTEDMK